MLSVCYVTAPTLAVAKNLSRLLVEARQAACVNIAPAITSVYEWEGKIHEDEECLLIIKTQTACIGDIVRTVTKHHPYDCPEVIALPVSEQGHEPYLQWMMRQTFPKTDS